MPHVLRFFIGYPEIAMYCLIDKYDTSVITFIEVYVPLLTFERERRQYGSELWLWLEQKN